MGWWVLARILLKHLAAGGNLFMKKEQNGKINKLAVDTMVLVYLINNEESYVDAVKKRLNSAKEVILSCMGMGKF